MRTIKAFLHVSMLFFIVFLFPHPATAFVDCNNNGIDDLTETGSDCNGNGVPDECDIQPSQTFVSVGINAPTEAAADLNEDGLIDTYGTYFDSLSSLHWIRLGFSEGNGVFRVQYVNPCIEISGSAGGSVIAVIDVNLDGHRDLLLECRSRDYYFPLSIGVLYSRGNGDFEGTQLLVSDLALSLLHIGDFNADNRFDIIGTQEYPVPSFALLVNNGNNEFTRVDSLLNAASSNRFELGDLNSDGTTDIVAWDPPNTIAYINDGAGSFSDAASILISTGVIAALHDVDNDGNLDILTTEQHRLNIYYGDGAGAFTPSWIPATSPYHVFAGDISGDGLPDLLYSNNVELIYVVQEQPRQFRALIRSRDGVYPFNGPVALSDFDQDGRIDLLRGAISFNRLSAFSADQNGNGLPDECEPSFRANPLYSLWNTNLGITNILELRNASNEGCYIQASAIAADGSLLGEVSLFLGAGESRDFIVDELFNLPPAAYGTIRVNHTGGRLLGGMSLYRWVSDSAESFACHYPLILPQRQTSLGASNAAYPLTSGVAGINGSVQNWLSIVNLDITVRVFRVIAGTSFLLAVPPMGRIDVEPHVSWSPFLTVFVTPLEPGAPYIAALSRFGSGRSNRGFSGAFANAHWLQQETGRAMYVPVSTAAGGLNYLEVHNGLFTTSAFSVEFFNDNGRSRGGGSYAVGPFLHFDAGSFLGASESGFAVVTPYDRLAPFFVQSVTYYRDPQTLVVTASDSSTSRFAFAPSQASGTNRFLGQENWLRASNISDRLSIITFSLSSLTEDHPFLFAGRTSYAFNHQNAVYVPPDTIGLVEIAHDRENTFLANVLRLQPAARGSYNFALSVPLN